MEKDYRGLFSQLGELKQNIENLKHTLGQKKIRITLNDDAVIVVVTGLQQIEKLELNHKKLPWQNQEEVARLVTRTVNEALKEAQELAKQEIKNITGGLNIPGLDGLL